MKRRVVVTGIGMVTPVGLGWEATWSALLAGKSGAAPITQFDASDCSTKFACEVRGFDATQWLDKRLSKTLDRFTQFAMVAAQMARQDAGLEFDDAEAHRVGVFVGAGLGGIRTIEDTLNKVSAKGVRRGVSPYFVPQIIINIAAGQISIQHNAKGPNLAQVSACSSSAHSVGDAYRCIERGDADVMFAGGAEATVTQLGVGGFNAIKALSTRNDAPERASRPFDAERDGFVMAEGAGMLILEEHSRAVKRGARIYSELRGYGLNSDAHHITAPSPDGDGAQRCMKLALDGAGMAPDEVDYINAHGTSTKFNDATETRAIKAVFGAHASEVAISSTKSMTGHLLGAAGSVETAIASLVVHTGVVPPTINYENPDPECDLNYTPNEARETRIDVALSNSFGFGGTNACLVVNRPTGS